VRDPNVDLLDLSDWIVESTALLPFPDQVALTCVSFTLNSELKAQAQHLTDDHDPAAVTAFLQAAVDLDLEIQLVASVEGGDSWPDNFGRLAGTYQEVSGLYLEDFDLGEVFGELPVPIFGSKWGKAGTIFTWGSGISSVVGAIGALPGLGHTGVVLALVAPQAGAVILVGTAVVAGGAAVTGYIRRHRREKAQRGAAAAAEARLIAEEEAERQRQEAEAAETERLALKKKHDEEHEEQLRLLRQKRPRWNLEQGNG
jgi:hypothetical protein